MSAIYALYADGDRAQRAVNGLRTAGVADERHHRHQRPSRWKHYEFGEMHRATRMWYIASGGGLVGLVFATWLTRMTELAWPLPTGNMPIVSWWPNLIVIFELTMLGAILATVVDAARHRRTAPARGRRSTIRGVSDGKILVGVESPTRADDVERALVAAGSPQITRI